MTNINTFFHITWMGLILFCLTACTGGDSDESWHIPKNIKRPDTDLNTVSTFQTREDGPTYGAVAELLEDGSVITWGLRDDGGYSRNVKSELYDIIDILEFNLGFIAVREDGTMIPWGEILVESIEMSGIKDELFNITQYYSSRYNGSFIFYRDVDDTAIVKLNMPWNDFSLVLNNVSQIFTNTDQSLFGVIYNDKSVDTWAIDGNSGGVTDSSTGVDIKLYNIDVVTGTASAWAALRSDKKVIVWGGTFTGGNTNIYISDTTTHILTAMYDASSIIGDELYNINTVRANYFSFSALRDDGKIITWGNQAYGAGGYVMSTDPYYPILVRDVSAELVNAASLYSNDFAFAAIKNDGSVVSWGLSCCGGDTSDVQSELYNIVNIEAFEDVNTGKFGFKATRSDDQTFIW